MENAPERPKKISELAEEIGSELGGGKRMSVGEKITYLKEHGNSLRINADFVSVDTYRSLFSSLDLRGKTIVNVGAGSAIGDSYSGVSPIMEALDANDEEVVCIPVDNQHPRTKSWDLLDTDDPHREGAVILAPVTADATTLPFQESSIDGYISTNLINEPRPEESEVTFVKSLFSEAYRVLKSGGFLIVSSFGYFWWKTEEGEILYNDSIDVEEMVTVEQIERYIREVGFSQVESIPLDTKEMQKAVQDRRARKQGAVDAGVVEACAFLARK
jgi:SAM-dependent methyltransferase